jgi:hypothetical protein
LFDAPLRDLESHVAFGDDVLRDTRDLIADHEAERKIRRIDVVVGDGGIGEFQAASFEARMFQSAESFARLLEIFPRYALGGSECCLLDFLPRWPRCEACQDQLLEQDAIGRPEDRTDVVKAPDIVDDNGDRQALIRLNGIEL